MVAHVRMRVWNIGGMFLPGKLKYSETCLSGTLSTWPGLGLGDKAPWPWHSQKVVVRVPVPSSD